MLSTRQCQQQIQEKPLDIGEIQYKYSDRIAGHLIKTFQIMYSFSSKKKNIWFSQSYLGKLLGLSRNRTCEIVGELVALGFIRKYYREHMTCEYEVVPYYLEKDQRFVVQRFFKSFFSFSVLAIFSISANSQLSTPSISKDTAGLKTTVQESYVLDPVLSLPMAVGLCYGFEKFQKNKQTTAGGTGTFEAEPMAPEQIVTFGDRCHSWLDPEPINETSSEYVQFEAQFVTEMPCYPSTKSSCSN